MAVRRCASGTRLRRSGAAWLCVWALVVVPATPAGASPGDLNTSFGTGGVVTYDAGGESWSGIADVAIVGSGATQEAVLAVATAEGAKLVWRDGSPTEVRLPLAGDVSMAADSAGRLVLVGTSGSSLLVLRYDGSTGSFIDSARLPGAMTASSVGFAGVAVRGSTIAVAGTAWLDAGRDSRYVARVAMIDTTTSLSASGPFDLDAGNTDLFVRDVALDGAGRPVVAGDARGPKSRSTDLFVARFTAAGVPDAGFSGDGLGIWQLTTADDTALGVTVDASDRPVAVGWSSNGQRKAEVVRFDTGGTPGSRVSLGVTGDDALDAVALGPDGAIWAAGRSWVGSKRSGTYDVLAAKVSTGFSVEWARATAWTGSHDHAGAIAIDPASGGALVGGNTRLAGTQGGGNALLGDVDAAGVGTLTVLPPSGSPEWASGVTTYGGGPVMAGMTMGTEMVPVVVRWSSTGTELWSTISVPAPPGASRWDFLGGVAADSSRIYVAGTAAADMVVVALHPSNGVVDTTFANNGYAVIDVAQSSATARRKTPRSNDAALAIAVDSQGRIVLGGRSGESLALVRLALSGSVDPTFSGDGIALIDPTGGSDYVKSLALLPDDSIVAAAQTEEATEGGTHWDVVVLRFDSAGANSWTTRTDIGDARTQDVVTGVAAVGASIFVGATRYGASGTELVTLRYDGFTGQDLDTDFVPGESGGVVFDGVGVLVTGAVPRTGGLDITARRYVTTGTSLVLDSSFGSGGVATIDAPYGAPSVVGATSDEFSYVGGNDSGDLFVAAVASS